MSSKLRPIFSISTGEDCNKTNGISDSNWQYSITMSFNGLNVEDSNIEWFTELIHEVELGPHLSSGELAPAPASPSDIVLVSAWVEPYSDFKTRLPKNYMKLISRAFAGNFDRG